MVYVGSTQITVRKNISKDADLNDYPNSVGSYQLELKHTGTGITSLFNPTTFVREVDPNAEQWYVEFYYVPVEIGLTYVTVNVQALACDTANVAIQQYALGTVGVNRVVTDSLVEI